MLEFKKYLEIKINLDYEIEKLKRNKKSIKKGVFDTLFKKGSCGNKSCSTRQAGEVGWNDDRDEIEGEAESYTKINLNPILFPNVKCYYFIKKEEEYLSIEIPKNIAAEMVDIKNYNVNIEKNKNQIFIQINKSLNNKIVYNKHTNFNNKTIIEYKILPIN